MADFNVGNGVWSRVGKVIWIMDGIKYVHKNRLVVESESSDENASLVAEGANSIVTENVIWFDPTVLDVSSRWNVEASCSSWNSTVHEDGNYPPAVFVNVNSYNNSELNNQYGFVCGVISYRTSEYVIKERTYSGDVIVGDAIYYDGNDKFWSLFNSRLDEDFQSPFCVVLGSSSSYSSSWSSNVFIPGGYDYYFSSFIPDVIPTVDSKMFPKDQQLPAKSAGPYYWHVNNAGLWGGSAANGGVNDLHGKSLAELRFYNRTMILNPGQRYNTYDTTYPRNRSDSAEKRGLYSFEPNFTGNHGVLPVGLVMLRDIVTTSLNRPLNNFGVYGFTIVMPFFIEPSQVVRGFSLGKELFVVGSGLKAEVFFAVSTTIRSEFVKASGLSNRNLGDGKPGRLDVLFKGGNGELLIGNQNSYTEPPTDNEVLNCTNVYHDIVDFSVPGGCNGVFYFKNTITYDMGVRYLVFGMRPYDINGNGKEYPPKENPFGTDTSYLGNYALVDISDKKFYLI